MLEALVFSYFIELGWIPYDDVITYDSSCHQENSFYLAFDTELKWSFFWIGGNVKIFTWHHEGNTFWPNRIDFLSRLGIDVGILTIGWRHLCSHPIMPYVRITDAPDGAFTEFFIRLSNRK